MICSARGADQALQSEEKRIFRGFPYIRSEAELTITSRTLDLAFLVATTTTTTDTTDYFTPAVHVRAG